MGFLDVYLISPGESECSQAVNHKERHVVECFCLGFKCSVVGRNVALNRVKKLLMEVKGLKLETKLSASYLVNEELRDS